MQFKTEIPTHARVAVSASKNTPQRVKLEGTLKSISIANAIDSGGNLWCGVNTEDGIEAIAPGQTLPITASENAVLRGFIILYWDESITDATEKLGSIIRIKQGEDEDC